MSQYISIKVTAPDQLTANKISEDLLNLKLAACIQINGPIESLYRWEGELKRDQEWQLTIKTRRTLFDQIVERINDSHPYSVPQILALPVIEGFIPYLEWLDEQTTSE